MIVAVVAGVKREVRRTGDLSGSMNHFRGMLSEIRGRNIDIEYLNPVNRWVGMG